MVATPPKAEVCLELQDNNSLHRSAIAFFGLKQHNDPAATAARLAHQFEAQNRDLLNLMKVSASYEYDGTEVHLRLKAGDVVGAVPLFSPSSAVPDYGLVIQPRFPWAGIGPMLADMGWKIAPGPLKLPLLRRSERKVPPWVISSMILLRLKALLEVLTRRFEIVNEYRASPRGTVHWPEYATRDVARGQFLRIPCTYPDLRDDRLLRGAVRYALEKQLRSLQTQVEHGAYVHRLIAFCGELLQRVRDVSPWIPSPKLMASWLQRPMKMQALVEGLQAIEWTVEDRGLAGISDLEGLPWRMPMDEFFEAWVETVFASIARDTAAILRVGRNRQTVHPIEWRPAYVGSQKALIPDIWLEWRDTTLIVDAKYKRHWEELQLHSWASTEELIREQHRNDLFQALTYANLARTQRVITCLAYPCTPETWASMKERGRAIHCAEVSGGSRMVHVWLTAIPMSLGVEEVKRPMLERIRETLA